METERLPPEAADSLRGLAEGYALPAEALRALIDFAELLAFDPLAPTSVREPARVVDDHIADSLVALELESVRAASVAADLGSGAGLPGVPLAVARPDLRVTLLESNGRKAGFLARAIEACRIANATVVRERAEAWDAGRGGCDLVTARAVAELDVVAEYAAPLLSPAGTLVVWRGRRDAQAEDRARRAAAILGLRYQDPVPVRPFSGALHRHLYVMSKVAATPDRFPRRPGMAEKRPLGGRS